jgi:hypothetical protein
MKEGIITKSVTSSLELCYKDAASLPFRSEHCQVCGAVLQWQWSHMTTEQYFSSTVNWILFVCYDQHISLEVVTEKMGESWGICCLSWSWQPCWMFTARKNQREKYQHENKTRNGGFSRTKSCYQFPCAVILHLVWYVLKVTLVLSCALQWMFHFQSENTWILPSEWLFQWC